MVCMTYLWTVLVWHRLSEWVEIKPWRILQHRNKTVGENVSFLLNFTFLLNYQDLAYSSSVTKWSPDSYSLKNTGLEHVVQSVSDSPLLKSAIQRGLTTRPSPGLDTLTGGEKETVLLLQSSSWSREGSKSGVSSSNIPQSLLRKHTHKDKLSHIHTHKCEYARYWNDDTVNRNVLSNPTWIQSLHPELTCSQPGLEMFVLSRTELWPDKYKFTRQKKLPIFYCHPSVADQIFDI